MTYMSLLGVVNRRLLNSCGILCIRMSLCGLFGIRAVLRFLSNLCWLIEWLGASVRLLAALC